MLNMHVYVYMSIIGQYAVLVFMCSSVWADKQTASARRDANIWCGICQSIPKPLKERV